MDTITVFIEASNIRAGGGLTHLIELLRHAAPEQHGIQEVVVAAPDSTLDKIEDRPWLTKYRHPYLNRNYLYRFLWQRFTLSGELKKTNALLFIPGGGKPLFKRPYITMCRNLLPLDYKELFRFGFSLTTARLLILRFLHLRAYRDALGVIFLTKYCYDILPEDFKRKQKNYQVIPHGINHTLFQGRTYRPRLDPAFKLLYISIINNYKHQDKVAQSVIRLRSEGHNIHLTLIGPSYKPALARLKSVLQGHDDAVTYRGKVPYNQVADAYRDHDAFILASTCETFCMILTEAMAMGMPIVCSSRSSLPETLGEAGIYFDPENELSLDSVILQLLESPELRSKLSQKALERSKGFSWQLCAEETFAFLAKISNQYNAQLK